MLDISIDMRQITARLSVMPDKLRAAFLKKTYALAEKLKSKVQQNLTNRLLKIRTGKLVRSIFEEVKNETNSVSGRVYSSGLPYARIQEFGGQTKAHIIEAKNGKALLITSSSNGITYGGFFKRVHHPGSKIKGAHYMGAAFTEMTPEIKAGYEEAAKQGTRE
jgi:hypothetical protein